MIDITYDSALEALRTVVARKGEDYRYARLPRNKEGQELAVGFGPGGMCYYVHTPAQTGNEVLTPGCIVGHVLVELGVPLEAIHAAEEFGPLPLAPLLERLRVAEVARATYGALWLLQAVQGRQDTGETWGEALTAGEAHYASQSDSPSRGEWV